MRACLTKLQVGTRDVTEADCDPVDYRYIVTTAYATSTDVTITLKTGVTLSSLQFMAAPDPGSANAPIYSGSTSTPSGTITWRGGSRATIRLTMDVPEIGEKELLLDIIREPNS